MKPISFEVEGLFDRPEVISIDLSKKVQIIFGVNGSGKTTVLKLLNSILRGSLYETRNIPFNSLALHLDSGDELLVERTPTESKVKGRITRKRFQLTVGRRKDGRWKNKRQIIEDVEFSEKVPLHILDRDIPELTRVGNREWFDNVTGEYLSVSDVIETYSDRLPWMTANNEIKWYKEIVSKMPVKFIQTQRLITFKSDESQSYQRRGVRHENTVIEYSEKLKDLIRDQLSNFVVFSQSLDSSYPSRLLQGQNKSKLSDSKLIKILEDTERLGKKLRDVDLLPRGEDIEIELKSISDGNRRAISLYLSDTIKKYENLENFADKLLLFLKIVNEKFSPRKTVSIRSHDGIQIRLQNEEPIHPRLLSSGEQHEIVLLFDLIFFSEQGTLVLIDEPEISLHIDWQRKFLSDVEAIGESAGLSFIMATHSPAIIGNRLDICEEV